jgi:hypothetical protein
MVLLGTWVGLEAVEVAVVLVELPSRIKATLVVLGHLARKVAAEVVVETQAEQRLLPPTVQTVEQAKTFRPGLVNPLERLTRVAVAVVVLGT